MDGIISFALDPIKQEVGYLIFYEGNFTKLTSCVTNLQGAKEAINNRVEAERKNGKRIEVGVQNWLEEVIEIIERANQLLEDPRRLEVGFSWWPFPNLISRYQLSRIATEVAIEAAEVWERRVFNQVAYLPALDETASSSATGGCVKFETRESFKDSILKALKDPKTHNVGVYGIGGVGKTTLVKEVAEIAKQQKLFDEVVTAHVSETPDIEKIQGVIADMLGLRFEEETTAGRAYRLKKRIEAEKTFLVILDDIWPTFELEKVGIPSSKEHNGCKLLMTSRTKYVLLELDVEKDFTFRLETLSETETWILFQSMAGDVVNDIRFRDVASEVANKCAGLPLLIVTVARGLKSKDIYAWENALNEIKRDGHKEMNDIISSVLELRYNWLESDEIKALFLLSAILGAGVGDSSMDYLLQVAMGLDIFKNINTVDNARIRLYSIIQSLKESCLLLEGSTSGSIQIHDVVCDVAISIARRDKHVYLVKSKHELEECLEKDLLKKCSQIILDQIQELPQRLDCPNVELVLLGNTNGSLKIPDTIFEGMGSLKVLDLTMFNLSTLPTSFHSLTGLHTQCWTILI